MMSMIILWKRALISSAWRWQAWLLGRCFFWSKGRGVTAFFLCGKSVESWVLNVLSLLFGITYIVGKIKFKLLFQGPLAKWVCFVGNKGSCFEKSSTWPKKISRTVWPWHVFFAWFMCRNGPGEKSTPFWRNCCILDSCLIMQELRKKTSPKTKSSHLPRRKGPPKKGIFQPWWFSDAIVTFLGLYNSFFQHYHLM